MRALVPVVTLCTVASLTACTKARSTATTRADGPPSSAASGQPPPACEGADACGWHALWCTVPGLNGVSDIARDADGRFWLLPEREPGGPASADREIVPADIPTAGGQPHFDVAGAVRFHLPDGPLDTESLVAIPGGFLVGTERGTTGAGDEVIYRLDRAAASVRLWARVDLSAWSLRSKENKGIEAMCRAGDRVVVVLEQWAEHGERTASPMAVFDERKPEQGPIFTGRLLHLKRDTRISAMTCALSEHGITLYVLEVEGGRGRPSIHLLRTLALNSADAARDESTIDIDTIVRRTGLDVVPNFEGVTTWNAGFVLASDNENDGQRQGATWLLELIPGAPDTKGQADEGGCK